MISRAQYCYKEMDRQETILKVQCHCELAQFSYTVSNAESTFPLKSSICHCNDCRHVTGALWGSFVVVPANDVPDFSSLTAYQSSKEMRRYFCPRCGATVGNIEPREFEFATGLLLHGADGNLLNRVQMHVASREDGGASIWMPDELYHRPLKRLSRGRDSEQITNDTLESMMKQVNCSTDERLDASCHCGAVQFYVKRPEAKAPNPRTSKSKYQAAPCPCQSCRLTSGSEWMGWCYVHPLSIRSLDGAPFDINHPSLTHYSSSPSVDRTFCKVSRPLGFYLLQHR